MKNKGVRTGVFFGSASGVITTLGLIVGLYAGTQSLPAVLGAILIIAVSDSMSDAFGVHLAEEAQEVSQLTVWLATLSTLATKFLVAITFVVPLLIFPLQTGVWLSVVWGAAILIIMSLSLARLRKEPAFPIITEHLAIGLLVIILSWLVGSGVHSVFGTA